MAQLDETITAGQVGHLNDHGQLHAKANYVVDVRDFGAVGDGSTDDASAIQAALDAAEGPSNEGGEVVFSQGRYAVETSLSWHSDVSLRGVGSDNQTSAKPVLLWEGAAGGTLIAMDTGPAASTASVDSLVFRSGTTNTAGILMDVQKRFDLPGTFYNCQWQKSTIAGLKFGNGGTNITIYGSRWDQNQGHSIWLTGGNVASFNLTSYTFDITTGFPADGTVFFDMSAISTHSRITFRDGNWEINAAVNEFLKLGRDLSESFETQYTVSIDGFISNNGGGLDETYELIRVYPVEPDQHRTVSLHFTGVNMNQKVRDWWTGLPITPPNKNIRNLSGNFAGDANGLNFQYVHIATPENAIAAPIGAICLNAGGGAGTTLFVKESGTPATAQGTLTMDTQPINGDTYKLDAKTYTFETSLTNVDGNVAIGGSLAQAKLNLVAAIDLSGTAGTDYATLMTRHTTVHVDPFISNDVIISARSGGTAGNSIATTETFDASTNIFDGAVLGTTTSGAGETGWVGK